MTSFCHRCADHVNGVFAFLDERTLARIERVSNEFRHWVARFREECPIFRQHSYDQYPDEFLRKYPKLMIAVIGCCSTMLAEPQFIGIKHLTVCLCNQWQRLQRLAQYGFAENLESLTICPCSQHPAPLIEISPEDNAGVSYVFPRLKHLDARNWPADMVDSLYVLLIGSPSCESLFLENISNQDHVSILRSLPKLTFLHVSGVVESTFLLSHASRKDFPRLKMQLAIEPIRYPASW